MCFMFFFFNESATTEIYTLSLHDALPILNIRQASQYLGVSADTLYKYVYEERIPAFKLGNRWRFKKTILDRSEEHTSELQSRLHLVCRLILEKKLCLVTLLPALFLILLVV